MRKYLIIGGVGVVLVGGFFALKSKSIDIRTSGKSGGKIQMPETTKGPLSGIECERGDQRPIAVMYPSDPETRPLAGIGQADMVFEMPVTENGITRMMAVFQCTLPSEIGSIRSAREDFIPYVRGLDAIYVHWGGEHNALALLDSGVTDNIDCLKLDGTTCKRKKGIPMPHNGYTTAELVTAKAHGLGYLIDEERIEYDHTSKKMTNDEGRMTNVPSLYTGTSAVSWTYNLQANTYARTRGGKPEIDRGTGSQVTASNIAVLRTTSTYVSILYNRVKTVGSGALTIYQNSTAIEGTWKKSSDASKLLFLDGDGDEIKLVPGSTWVEIVTK